MSSDNSSGVTAPWHLWLIATLLLAWNGLAVFDYVATVLRFEPYLLNFTDEALAYYYAAPLWMFAMWGIGSWGGFITAILLYMRNKLAAPVFALSLVCSVVAVAYAIVNPPPGGASNNLSAIVIILIAALLLVYVIRLKRQGVLY